MRSSGAQEAEFFSPAPQARAFPVLRVVDPSPNLMSPAPAIANRCERAGERVGSLAWRLVSRPLRWLDGWPERASTPLSHGVLVQTGTQVNPAEPAPAVPVRITLITAPPLPVAPDIAAEPRLFTPRVHVPPAWQRAPAMVNAHRLPSPGVVRPIKSTEPLAEHQSWRSISAEAIELLREMPMMREVLQRWLGPYLPELLLGAAGIAGLLLAGGTGLTPEITLGFAAEAIPPLLGLALFQCGRPSWAHLAASASSAAIHASRAIHRSWPEAQQDRSFLVVLTSIALAVASAVSPSLLLNLATASPWTLALVGGLILIAIVGRALAKQGQLGLASSPAVIRFSTS